MGLAVKESSDSEPRRVAGELKKNCAPWSIVFSPRLARARVPLSFESACRAHAGAVCVQKFLSLVSEDFRCHIPALPAWGTSRDVQRPGSLPISAG